MGGLGGQVLLQGLRQGLKAGFMRGVAPFDLRKPVACVHGHLCNLGLQLGQRLPLGLDLALLGC
jgi:hypothetical protein